MRYQALVRAIRMQRGHQSSKQHRRHTWLFLAVASTTVVTTQSTYIHNAIFEDKRTNLYGRNFCKSFWSSGFRRRTSLTFCQEQPPAGSKDDRSSLSRTYQTPVDLYFQKFGKIPSPSTIHAVLPKLSREGSTPASDPSIVRRGILVIGDVHGCYDELMDLYAKAVQENGGCQFVYVILVGDLVNKGPASVATIRHVRQRQQQALNSDTEQWLSIRGNHDDGALAAALGDPHRKHRKRYRWIFGENPTEDVATEARSSSSPTGLSDEDVIWMSELPYTLRIPAELLNDSVDTLVVHAGLIPGVALEEQTSETMITVRCIQKQKDATGNVTGYAYWKPYKKGENSESDHEEVEPWARVWAGPERVIFGHDARRGLQLYSDNMAIGLDTGACYGKQLTGIILPGRKIVQVEARKVHCPPGVPED